MKKRVLLVLALLGVFVLIMMSGCRHRAPSGEQQENQQENRQGEWDQNTRLQIKKGMTGDQVKSIMGGDPTETSYLSKSEEEWEYHKSRGSSFVRMMDRGSGIKSSVDILYVRFKDGRVSEDARYKTNVKQ